MMKKEINEMNRSKKKCNALFSIVMLILCVSRVDARTLRVGTVHMPPYQMLINDELSGSVFDLIDCALNLTDIPYDLTLNSWQRIVSSLKSDDLDLIFSLEASDELVSFSSQSMPLVFIKWIWLSNMKVDSQNRDLPITVVLSSPQAIWLKQQGYTNVHYVGSYKEALQKLNLGKVNTLLVEETSTIKLAKQLQLDLTHAYKEFNRFTTLSAYVSKQYLAINNEFMGRLNDSILDCHPIGLELDEHSRLVLTAFSKQLLPITRDKGVIEKLRRQNKFPLQEGTILYQDREWKEQRKRQASPMISRLLNNLLSKRLKAFSDSYQGVFNEIFVVDKSGLIIALSHVSTDFWQGDESKFKKVFNNKEQSIFICRIRFDQSTNSFLSHVSMLIKDPDSGEDIGVFIFGINVDALLNAGAIQLDKW